MPNKVAIVTDSTAYLPEDCLKQYNISVTPLSVVWGEQDYLDGVDILPDEFYNRLANSKVVPTTSQVTPATMHSKFQSLLEQGYDVLGIFISSKISGTVQSAIQAREMIPGAADRIAVVDSQSTTMALGWPVLTAARAAQAGERLGECQKAAENARQNSGVLFIVETLEFLRRGGRIGGAQAFLGTALNIKPVLEMRAGKIEAVEKVRTKQKAMRHVVGLVSERIKGKAPIRLAVTHANCESDALSLLEAARVELDPVETHCCSLSPVIGTHTGPGTIALNYMSGVL
ncbi:MAG TPA: DegV family protein [Anaerolineales bacterium]|nr:DegV family protein [Anaerolineales bacterium]